MARMRSVKPEFWADEELADLCRDARLLYIGLWNLSDEHGRLRGNPSYIKGQLFPYDDDLDPSAIDSLLLELVVAGKVVRYTVNGKAYLHLPNLSKHQRLEPDKVPSRLPAPPTPEPVPTPEPRPESRANTPAPRADKSESHAKDHALSRQHVAGSMQQQHARSRAPAAAVRIVLEAEPTCSTDEAEAVVAWVQRERKPRNVGAVLRTIIGAGELAGVLEQVRAEQAKHDSAVLLKAARDGPVCEHGEAGGATLHPQTGKPLCPLCRAAA